MTEKKSLTIGLFDSGIGGLSILPHILKEIPYAKCFYIADDFFAPYGEKKSQVVIERSVFLVNTLLKKKVDLIVVACNTATAVAINHLRSLFPQIPFVGVEPYINILSKEKFLASDKIGVLSTTLTSQSERFKKLKLAKDPENRINSYASEKLAMLVEEVFKLGKIDDNIRRKIEQEVSFLQDEKLNYLILGCTHYSLIKKTLEDILHVKAISPCESVAKRVAELSSLSPDNSPNIVQSQFFFLQSSRSVELQGELVPLDLIFENWDITQIPFL